MSKVTPTLLNDTLSLVQLVRETALAQGKQTRAEKLAPVVNNLRVMVNSAREAQSPQAPSGILAQGDFRALLDAARSVTPASSTGPAASAAEKHQLIRAMYAGSMSEVDIARQMGMTREEVRLVLSIHQKTRFYPTGGIR